VVRSGTDQSRRRAAVEALHGVLRTVADLEAWLAAYDAKVAAEGLDAPLIRKALGAVLGAQPERALDQYRKALALQPEDRETHDRIVALLDRLGRPAEAAAATWRAVRIDPTDLGRIRALAQRLRDLDRRTEAERALSELVEHRPHEADGHAVYAEALEEAGRFAEAVEQRRQAVRARPDDPDERLRLAATQIRADDRPGARRTLEEVLAGSWAERFKDAKDRALALLRDL
jgi:tetratricopeptide (TPR) repeat protein